ncbi:hypothetical protein B4065_1978 [Caldibacillus thermoamylovorans]|nr:hypothetical protein B4065_1978 [Caldibacillus thermoamylovorans]
MNYNPGASFSRKIFREIDGQQIVIVLSGEYFCSQLGWYRG